MAVVGIPIQSTTKFEELFLRGGTRENCVELRIYIPSVQKEDDSVAVAYKTEDGNRGGGQLSLRQLVYVLRDMLNKGETHVDHPRPA